VSVGGPLEQRCQQPFAALPFVLRRLPRSPLAPAGNLGSFLVSQRTGRHSGDQVPESLCEETRMRAPSFSARETAAAHVDRVADARRIARMRLGSCNKPHKRMVAMADLEKEISELLEGHRLQPHQRQALQQGELDADTVRSLQRMLANTQNAVLRLAREIDQLRVG
jgi:hypothetical protein